MKVVVYDQKGEQIGETELPVGVFGVAWNGDLVHQVAEAMRANRRKNIAKTKDRSEVRGGGRKPWRQKGTGRARHGSIRSPLWRGGGVTFGPTTEKVFKKKITKKMRKKALFMVLSAKAKKNLLLILDKLNFEKIKTKAAKEIADKLFLNKGSGLIALNGLDKKVILSFRNIPKVSVVQAKDLNVLDLLSYKYLIMPKEAIKAIEETFKS
jgi:large subunit ribosomal protein L4